ncbi:unnamed protein product [Rangifer tarandus platyrhynchus]|uniref:Uncharacterized protein n=2 Tax=Rangifer tarandus platyrhynchus TaxID=3082113 RepID=A0ABN8YH18_RANTA|nr:unnamed protein product [Rangifer tarandus platyrhynchus]
MPGPPLSMNQLKKPFALCAWEMRAQGVDAGRAKQPPHFGEGFWGPVPLGSYTSISDCGCCELLRCPERGLAFKVKVGHQGWEECWTPIPGRLVSSQASTCLLSQHADSTLSSRHCEHPHPSLLSKVSGLPKVSEPRRLSSGFYPP